MRAPIPLHLIDQLFAVIMALIFRKASVDQASTQHLIAVPLSTSAQDCGIRRAPRNTLIHLRSTFSVYEQGFPPHNVGTLGTRAPCISVSHNECDRNSRGHERGQSLQDKGGYKSVPMTRRKGLQHRQRWLNRHLSIHVSCVTSDCCKKDSKYDMGGCILPVSCPEPRICAY